MPNWVKNKLTIGGENCDAVINELLVKDKDGEPHFDFNKIIPMPESLNIISGTVTDRCVSLYLTSINPNNNYHSSDKKLMPQRFAAIIEKLVSGGKSSLLSEINLSDETIKKYEKAVNGYAIDKDTKLTLDSALEYGKRAVDNVLQYGHMNWYDWSIANWGTKWNACETHINGNEIEFDTAWSDVCRLIVALSAKYPENSFQYEFAEEQPGYYAGTLTFENGDMLCGDIFSEYSKDAYEKYFEFWGGEENYDYDEVSGTYKYSESEAAEM